MFKNKKDALNAIWIIKNQAQYLKNRNIDLDITLKDNEIEYLIKTKSSSSKDRVLKNLKTLMDLLERLDNIN
jgi:hypothetical protein